MGKLNNAILVTQLNDDEFITVILNDGSLGRIKKSTLMPYTGAECKWKRWKTLGWHRIIIGINNNFANSGIINIANDYGSAHQSFSCFYIAGGGYLRRMVSKIGGDGTIFPKVRFVYKTSTSVPVYIDIFYNTTTDNSVRIALSASLGIHLSDIADTIVDIPEGYVIQEFDLK